MRQHEKIVQYIAHYAPSRKRLLEYCDKKHVLHAEQFLLSCGYDESVMLQLWTQTYIAGGKSKREIYQKLLRKKFVGDDVKMLLDTCTEFDDWNQQKIYIQGRIETLLQRGKAKIYIASYLRGLYPNFSQEIQEVLDTYSTTEQKNLRVLLQKLQAKFTQHDKNSTQKIIQSLLQKGFRYEDIRREMQEKE